jgi:hypothetical protein
MYSNHRFFFFFPHSMLWMPIFFLFLWSRRGQPQLKHLNMVDRIWLWQEPFTRVFDGLKRVREGGGGGASKRGGRCSYSAGCPSPLPHLYFSMVLFFCHKTHTQKKRAARTGIVSVGTSTGYLKHHHHHPRYAPGLLHIWR